MDVDNACALIALSILCWLVQTGCSATTSDDFLVDEAGLLHPAEAKHLRDLHHAMLEDFDIHFLLIILAESPADINQATADLFW